MLSCAGRAARSIKTTQRPIEEMGLRGRQRRSRYKSYHFNGEILSYSISLSPNFAQTRVMMRGLFSRLPSGTAPLLYSDQGWQYQMKELQEILVKHNMTQSISRKGNCLDDSVMENFFGRLKTEMFFGEKFNSV